jgi:hypothetical protein
MASRYSLPLSKPELEQFIRDESDFSFEMSVLSALRELGLQAEHAAVYTDPITNRLRTYDIRARWSDAHRWIRFAVECKNLKTNAPLLVHATPRSEAEAYRSVVTRSRIGGLVFQTAHRARGVYEPGEAVGRHTDQPMKDKSGAFKSSDAATFEKWLQAVSGCFDLLSEVVKGPLPSPQAHAILPILVVPAKTLWQVDYDERGTVKVAVRAVERTTIILRHAWSVNTGMANVTYDLSHLEIVTFPALRQRVKNLIDAGGILAGSDELLTNAQR